MLKLDRLITLTGLNAELLPITVNDFGEQEGGSPDTTARVWARREILGGGEYFRSDGRTSGQNLISASFFIRHRDDIVPLKSGIIDADRRMWAIRSITELRERGRSRWLRLEAQHSSESFQDSVAPFVGRETPEPDPVVPPVSAASFLLLENGDRLLLEDGSRLLLEGSA